MKCLVSKYTIYSSLLYRIFALDKAAAAAEVGRIRVGEKMIRPTRGVVI